jgi:DNA repair protein RAD51
MDSSYSSPPFFEDDGQAMEVDMTYTPRPVTELQGFGIQMADIDRLTQVGFTTIEAVAYTPKRQLIHVTGIPEQRANKILDEGYSFPSYSRSIA